MRNGTSIKLSKMNMRIILVTYSCNFQFCQWKGLKHLVKNIVDLMTIVLMNHVSFAAPNQMNSYP